MQIGTAKSTWRTLVALSAFTFLFQPIAAEAIIYQIPAVEFAKEFSDDSGGYDAITGVLHGSRGAFVAAVPFVGVGRVCGMALVYKDEVAGANIRALLHRKKVAFGKSANSKVAVIGGVVSPVGAQSGIQSVVTNDFSGSKLDASKEFYSVKVEFGDLSTDDLYLGLAVLGVQLDIREASSSCL